MVGLKEILWRNNISLKKDTGKVVLLQVKGLFQIVVKSRAQKKIILLIVQHTHTKHPFDFWGAQKGKTIV